MFRALLRLSPGLRPSRRLASLCAAGALLAPACCNMPMGRYLENGPPTPGPLSIGLTPPLQLTAPPPREEVSTHAKAAGASIVYHTVHHGPDAPAVLPNTVAVSLDNVLRMAHERNPEILVARERVHESQIAFDAAMQSCMPEMLRKDTFKKPVAEAQLWRRRAELRKIQTEKLEDAGNTYLDMLTARRGEAIGADLQKYEEQLRDRAKKLVESGEKPAKVIVEAIEAVLNNQRQVNLRTRQQGDAAAAKLAYLLGMGDGVPMAADETLAPVDLADATASLSDLVRQARENGPGVAELQGLAAAIQQGIADSQCAQRICDRTGAALICGRLQMANSEWQQAQLALVDLQGKLRAGVEAAVSEILSGRQQIAQATEAIGHAVETYRLTDVRLKEEGPEANRRNNTYNAVLRSIQQLSQAHANYLSAVRAYNKAQVRLLLLLGTYNDCKPNPHNPAQPEPRP